LPRLRQGNSSKPCHPSKEVGVEAVNPINAPNLNLQARAVNTVQPVQRELPAEPVMLARPDVAQPAQREQPVQPVQLAKRDRQERGVRTDVSCREQPAQPEGPERQARLERRESPAKLVPESPGPLAERVTLAQPALAVQLETRVLRERQSLAQSVRPAQGVPQVLPVPRVPRVPHLNPLSGPRVRQEPLAKQVQPVRRDNGVLTEPSDTLATGIPTAHCGSTPTIRPFTGLTAISSGRRPNS
jgi:hypothetical protein